MSCRSLWLLCVLTACAEVLPQPVDPAATEPAVPGPLAVSPDPLDLTAGPAEVRAQLRAVSATHGDVTEQAQWSLSRPELGDVQAGRLTIRGGLMEGGLAEVRARFGAQSGAAQLRLKLIAPDLPDPSAPADARDHFSGPEGGARPAWLYPFAGAMLARNIGGMNLQWTGTPDARAYRVRVEAPTYVRDLYAGPGLCPGGRCQLRVPDSAWLTLLRSTAGGKVTLTLSASPGPGQPVGTAPPRELAVAPEDLEGGLFYWNATTQRLFRVPLSSKFPVLYHNSDWNCVGCHTVSPDGKRVALTVGPNNLGRAGLVDAVDPTRAVLAPGSAGQWYHQSFSPKGDMLLIGWRGRARIIHPETGAKLYDVPEEYVGGGLAFAEWSPDGRAIAFVRFVPGGGGDDPHHYDIGDIMIMPWNDGRFGPPELIVAAKPREEYHFYPSWSPDSQWIVFSTGRYPCGGFFGGDNSLCSTYGPARTRLRLVRALPGQEPLELERATHEQDASTNWPRFAPLSQGNGRLAFISFAGKFPYGFVKTDRKSQLWLAAIDLDKARSGQGDPSYAPIWLPFQRPYESNHLGSWTRGLGCYAPGDCPQDHRCVAGSCVRIVE